MIAELVALEDVGTWWWFALLPTLVRLTIELGDLDLAATILHHTAPQVPYTQNAVAVGTASLLEARKELEAAAEAYADAVRRWDDQGVVPELAFALLGHGRTLVALARREDARLSLERAQAIFADLRAAPALRDVDAAMRSLDASSART